MASGKVRGVPETVRALRSVRPTMDRHGIDLVYAGAKAASAALRATAPQKPLSRAQGGAVRAVATKGVLKAEGDKQRLATVRLYGPKWTVVADMARVSHGSTFVPNLDKKWPAPSRWVWPTVERFIPMFNTQMVMAQKRTEVEINLQLRKMH